MSTICRLLLSTCAPALLLACVARPLAQSSAPRLAAAAPHFDFEAELHAEALQRSQPPLTNPYAPVRSRNATRYSWQSEQRAECDSEASVNQAEPESNAARRVFAALPERASQATLRVQPATPDLVVAALRPALHRCFSRWVDTRLDAQGSVRFALELGCTGDVAAVSAENQGIDETTLECLFSVVAPAHFAPPPGGHATVLVPVVFKNAAR